MFKYYQRLQNPLIRWSLAGLVFSVISVGLWLVVQKPTTELYFGTIVAVSTDSITLQNRQETRVLPTASTTVVVKEKNKGSIDLLQAGQFVQVTLDTTKEEPVVTSIRLLKKPPERPRHE